MREKLILPVTITILVVWVSAAGFSFIAQQYVPLEVATPVMLVMTGYVFGIQISRNGKRP
jgi:hypothetical protein